MSKEFLQTLPPGCLDWILLQLLSPDNGEVVAARSFFLRQDGWIVDESGNSTGYLIGDLNFDGVCDGNDYQLWYQSAMKELP